MKKILDTVKKHKIASLILTLVFIGACSNLSTSSNVKTASEPTTKQNQTQPEKQHFTFDIPSLIGKNIDQIRKTLGKPSDNQIEPTKLQLQVGGANMQWDNSFEKNGNTLLVTYESKSRKIIDFFIDSPEPNTDKQSLMAIGNINEMDKNYTLEFVKAIKDPSILTGLKVVPK